jgi:hypothetical protein
MKKNYQNHGGRAQTGRTTPKKVRLDATRVEYESALTLPDTVTVAISELADDFEDGLLALVVGAGLRVLDTLFEHETTVDAWPRGKHDPDRRAVRHGSDTGLVALGGRQVEVTRPRLRTPDRSAEVTLPLYEWARQTDLLERHTMATMLAKLSCRRYPVGLEPVGEAVAARSRGTTKSAVSRRFVAATESALAELLAQDLSVLDIVVIMVDGVIFAGHTCVVALGIDVDGSKSPLALAEGDTENATLVKGLLVGLRDRGLDVTRPTLFVIDGSTALPPAIKAVFDHPVIGRCQEHKIRNVRGYLPDGMAKIVERRMRAAYKNLDPLVGQGDLEALAKELERSHPGAAGSLREGLAETFTVARLKVPPTLFRTLRSTNCVESMIEICRDHSRNVKRWRDGQMILRWRLT